MNVFEAYNALCIKVFPVIIQINLTFLFTTYRFFYRSISLITITKPIQVIFCVNSMYCIYDLLHDCMKMVNNLSVFMFDATVT